MPDNPFIRKARQQRQRAAMAVHVRELTMLLRRCNPGTDVHTRISKRLDEAKEGARQIG